eukprot:1160261-Pelagomonas_calceolata.AAC.10
MLAPFNQCGSCARRACGCSAHSFKSEDSTSAGCAQEHKLPGWQLLVNTRSATSTYVRLGSRRAIRKERNKHQLQHWRQSPEAQEALKANIKSLQHWRHSPEAQEALKANIPSASMKSVSADALPMCVCEKAWGLMQVEGRVRRRGGR